MLPGVTPGDYHFLVRGNWQHEVFEATALSQAPAASDAVRMDVPELTLGCGPNETLTATGEAKLFKVGCAERRKPECQCRRGRMERRTNCI